MDISREAEAALTNVGTSRIGAQIPSTTPPEVRAELENAGAIGLMGGLTMRGSIHRDRIQSRDLDLLF